MGFNLPRFVVFFCLSACTKCVKGFEESSGLIDIDFTDNQKSLKRGEETLKEYQSRDSPCWLKAVSGLQSKCSDMSDIEQSILAMKFANCHFEKSGMDTFACIDQENFKSCTNLMKKEDPTSFLVYTEFFTHVTDICFYLQSDLWRKKTSQTISKLSLTTEETVEKLGQSLDNQKMVLDAQNQSLANQKNILKNEEVLQQALKNSTASAKSAFEEMKQKADEQKAVFSNTFDGIFAGVDKLAELQSMLLGEFISLQSFAFYSITIVTCYLITSTPSTSGARLLLFGSFLLMVFIEKVLVNRAYQSKDVSPASNETLYAHIWLLRKAFIAFSLFIIGYFASTYQDLNHINNQLLRQIQAEIQKIHELEKGKESRFLEDKNDAMNNLYLSDLSKTDGLNNASAINLRAHASSTPQKKKDHLYGSFMEIFTRSPFKSQVSSMHTNYDIPDGVTKAKESQGDKIERADMLFSDDDQPDVGSKKKSKIFSKKNFQKSKPRSKRRSSKQESVAPHLVNENLNTSGTSRYNLRRRSGTPVYSPTSSFLSVSKSNSPSLKRTKGKEVEKAPVKIGKGLFSSDEED